MVHKKSEYRLQFHLLAKDLRKQIWQENTKARESYRSLNRADHYWSYQLTDEHCQCENGEEDEEEAALPPHKLKHKMLLARYENAKMQNGAEQYTLPSPSQVTRADRNAPSGTDSQDIERESQKQRSKSELSYEIQNLSHSSHTATKPTDKQIAKKQQNPTVHSHRSVKIKEPSSQSIVSTDDRLHDTSTSLGHRSGMQRNLSKTSALTRTTRNAYFKDKKSPFATFGWNDSTRNIGEKKTYNVYAPENEVYSPALWAMKRRRKEIERYLAEEAHRRRQELTSHSGVVNHSSIWMTEYQDKFTQGNRFTTDHLSKRPSSAASYRGFPAWRYS